MALYTYNKNNNIIYGAIIFLIIFIIGLILFSSNCNNKVSTPCENTQVMCNLNNYIINNKTQYNTQYNTQNITFYYLDLICNYESNNTCTIYDGQFYNYDIAYDYFNYYYNNSNIYNVYLLDNTSYCTFDVPNKNTDIVILGLCIMVIITIIFLISCCYYYVPHIKQQIKNKNYVPISDNPPAYSPT
jgi:hypothetical protein